MFSTGKPWITKGNNVKIWTVYKIMKSFVNFGAGIPFPY